MVGGRLFAVPSLLVLLCLASCAVGLKRAPRALRTSAENRLDSVNQEKAWQTRYPSYEELMDKYGLAPAPTASSNRSASPPRPPAMLDPERLQELVAKYVDHVSSAVLPGGNATANQLTKEEFRQTMKRYWEKYPDFEKLLHGERAGPIVGGEALSPAAAGADADELSFVEVASTVTARKAQGGCEVCVYVVENKEQHQPFLCRGLKPPQYQQSCVSVLVSLMWWLENEVYWLNYGCQRQGASGGGWEWVKPCPAHAVCSFIQSLYDRSSFCPADPNYRKPAA